MAGTREGGKKASKRNRELYGSDFYKRIGQKGGASGNTGGFRSDKKGEDGLTGKERASVAGRKGGLKSKRGPAKVKKEIQPTDKVLRSISLDLEEERRTGLIHDVVRRFTR